MEQRVINREHPIIAWWSGGATSAVACKWAIEWFGGECVRIVFIDTKNEDDDTYRFKIDCEAWYGQKIETITNEKYKDIYEVWYRFLTLNTAHGAICSSELKREVRLRFQRENKYSYQIFGYDMDEPKHPKAFTMNYADSHPIYPLLLHGYTKKMCIRIVQEAGIKVPDSYIKGLNNNNCGKTGCIQGGIGYWQWMKENEPLKFDKMAETEHELTGLKGKPVTILKDQSKGGGLVFLKPHPNFPLHKDISMMKGRPPEPLLECNGWCGISDLSERNPTENEINYQS